MSEVELADVLYNDGDEKHSRRIAPAINGFITSGMATVATDATIILKKNAGYPGSLVDLITDIEQLPVEPDQIARVVIDENSGTIVMGTDVRVSTVAIAQGNLTIKVAETPWWRARRIGVLRRILETYLLATTLKAAARITFAEHAGRFERPGQKARRQGSPRTSAQSKGTAGYRGNSGQTMV